MPRVEQVIYLSRERVQDPVLKSRFTGNLIRDRIIDLSAYSPSNEFQQTIPDLPLLPLAYVFHRNSRIEKCFQG